jgi:diguanylate cyclase (GGDEF)-like protein/PAS domain S-box-containing protein
MPENTVSRSSAITNIFSWTVIVAGAMLFLFAILSADFASLGYSYILFSLVTLIFASRIVVAIPKVKGHISVSDTLIFLSILIFGGEAGVILSTVDAIPASYKLTKKPVTLLFNISVFAVSTSFTVLALRLMFGSLSVLTQNEFSGEYVMAICLMGLFQYFANSSLVAILVALRSGKPIWQTWKDNFLWTSITYFAGASAAGIIAKGVAAIGIYAFLAAVPIIAVVYFTYTTYLKSVETATEKADLAQQHVRELSLHIAEQERIAQALKESEQYFRNAFDHAAGMAVVSPDGRWLQVNDSLCSMLGYSEAELLRDVFQNITDPEDVKADIEHLEGLLADKFSSYQLEKRYRHKSGHMVWVLQSASLIRDVEGSPRSVILQIQNITDRKDAEELIRHAAFHDALTGLPNRVLFTDRLSMSIERAKRTPDHKFAVIFLDLDRFKIVNDSLGHGSGDMLLIELASRLQNCVRTVDSVARLGGDEFVILLDGVSTIVDATTVAERIQESLKEPFDLDGQEFFTTASMGIACSTQIYDKPEDILRDADTAMYRAKAKGKARHELFDATMHTRAVQALSIENELRRALENGDIQPYYQAIVSLGSGEIVGFEALARWIHLERGLISPADFVPLAEECGLIVPIGKSVLLQACEQGSIWQKQYELPDLTMSVNLSGKQFKQSNLASEIKSVLRKTDFDPKNLKLEITETMVIEDIVSAVEMLNQIIKLGVQISIDDFGTGYSSLSYLHRFPFDALKIDRSFVARMTKDRESLGIVKTIATLADELEKDVIAEGVETAEQWRLLNSFGCRYGQGFYFSKPIDRESAGELISGPRPWGRLNDQLPVHVDLGVIEVENPREM